METPDGEFEYVTTIGVTVLRLPKGTGLKRMHETNQRWEIVPTTFVGGDPAEIIRAYAAQFAPPVLCPDGSVASGDGSKFVYPDGAELYGGVDITNGVVRVLHQP